MIDCFDYAIRYISRYPKTAQGLREQLVKKGYEAEIIEPTIEELIHKSYLDDRLYIELYLRGEVIRKGKPIFPTQQKLLKKGVDRSLLQEVLAEIEEELHAGVQKGLMRMYEKLVARDEEQQKIIEKLVRRGYAFRDVQEVIEKSKVHIS